MDTNTVCLSPQYSVLVTTDMDTDIQTTVTDYDGRSGVPESVFCQDNQGLGMRKRRKRSFCCTADADTLHSRC
jgi:hypothetical protein